MSENQYTELEKMRHSGAHVLAAAVKMYLDNEHAPVKFAIGPPIDNGFYYDFDFGTRVITEKDLKEIEKKMRWIVNKDIAMTSRTVSIDEARKISADQPYKLELLEDFEKKGITEVSYYAFGNLFEDLCRGNHTESTGKIGAYKVDKIAGAYWRGDSNNKQLTRIYALMFATPEELEDYLKMREEASKRDHRKLGQELDLFAFSDLVGPGLPLFTPKGTVVRNQLTKFVIEMQEPLGYQAVDIPHLTSTALYKTSGHLEKYGEDLFVCKTHDKELAVKPMNCPHHTQIFASRQRSYKELPIAYYEVTKVYRNEQSGELQGLSRVLSITQDDGHVFCRPDQIQSEAGKIMSMINKFYKTLGMEMTIRLSRRDEAHPEKYLGGDELWINAEEALRSVLKAEKITDYIDGPGEAAFYGPKLDFIIKDAIGRPWQVATIQLDFNMPERFGLEYVDTDGTKKHPVMIHRAILGSVERCMSMLIEHFAGNFPTWLAPVQVKILTLNEEVLPYAEQIEKKLKEAGVRVEVDARGESIGKKIREAETWKIPYSLVIGAQEAEAGKVALRKRHDGDKGTVTAEDFIKMIVKEIEDRSL